MMVSRGSPLGHQRFLLQLPYSCQILSSCFAMTYVSKVSRPLNHPERYLTILTSPFGFNPHIRNRGTPNSHPFSWGISMKQTFYFGGVPPWPWKPSDVSLVLLRPWGCASSGGRQDLMKALGLQPEAPSPAKPAPASAPAEAASAVSWCRGSGSGS